MVSLNCVAFWSSIADRGGQTSEEFMCQDGIEMSLLHNADGEGVCLFLSPGLLLVNIQ